MTWNKLTHSEINQKVTQSLNENTSFKNDYLLGIPASHLDSKVFYDDAPFLSDAPFLRTLISNPNHIGCHTIGESERYFKGTHRIERELINLCGTEILNATSNSIDGYVTSGGTEANLQAIWIYRNYFIQEVGAHLDEIAIICSEDTHYAVYKAANLMCVDLIQISVDSKTRQILESDLEKKITESSNRGKRNFIVICNMATTMFGSVDDIYIYRKYLNEFEFKIHVDGAYGGFIYPFSNRNNDLTFSNPLVSSITLDAHKLAQAPYGTGIFLCRKNLMEFVVTKEAQYVQGNDITLIGSRSGANAVAVWMILMTYGFDGWKLKVNDLIRKTDYLCSELQKLNIDFYRNPFLNIVTIKANELNKNITRKFNLVPDDHTRPNWYKIVIMDHVRKTHLSDFINDLKDIHLGKVNVTIGQLQLDTD